MQDLYELDPDGDVVLILTDGRDVGNELPETPPTVLEATEGPPLEPDAFQFLWPPHVNTSVAEASTTDPLAEPLVEAPTEDSIGSTLHISLTDGSINTDTPGLNKEVRFRVSSRHMALASPVFRVMLQQEFKEATILRSTGKVEVTLAEDCAEAFLILLNIIHGYTRRVPHKIDLNTLTQIAIIVDKYSCLEVVELFSEMWLEELKNTLPGSFTETLLPWLCITWVFRKPDEFKHVTRIAQRESSGCIEEDLVNRLPIPSFILGRLYPGKES
jgi:BTB/POZ domain